ncbi:hypothetical protein V6N13_007805 [Hibiscus sabdariffa]
MTQHKACPPVAGVLLFAACCTRPLAFLEFFLRLVQPFVGLRITTTVGVVLEGFLPWLVGSNFGPCCVLGSWPYWILLPGWCRSLLACVASSLFLTWPALQANSLAGAARVGYYLAVRTVGRPVSAFPPIACGFATHLPSLCLVAHQGSRISQLPACVHAGSTRRGVSFMSTPLDVPAFAGQ